MKKTIILIGFLVGFFISCTDSDDIKGDIESLTPDYNLPQGKSPADSRIVEFYQQSGSYILYEYTELDIKYGFKSSGFSYTLADPQYAGNMLDLLDDIWFDFCPQNFLKEYAPLKIFLADTLGVFEYDEFVRDFAYVETNCIAVSYCSDTLLSLPPKTKLEFKNNLQKQLWLNWINVLDMPEEFFEVSSYSTKANTTDKTSNEYARKRGFIMDYSQSRPREWSNRVDNNTKKLDSHTDLKSFLIGMVIRTSDQWTSDLAYPLVKEKYDIIHNWFLEKYHIDLQKIGDASYE